MLDSGVEQADANTVLAEPDGAHLMFVQLALNVGIVRKPILFYLYNGDVRQADGLTVPGITEIEIDSHTFFAIATHQGRTGVFNPQFRL